MENKKIAAPLITSSTRPDKQSKNRGSSVLKIGSVIVLIIALAISALGNLYPNTNVITLTKFNEHIAVAELQHTLTASGYSVQSISQSGGADMVVQLNSPSLSAPAASLLRQTYPLGEVKVTKQATTPLWMQRLAIAPIDLGLDLGGGVLFVLQVDTQKALENRVGSVFEQVNSLRIEKRLRGVSVHKEQHGVIIRAQGAYKDNAAALSDELKTLFPDISANQETNSALYQQRLFYTNQQQQQFAKADMEQALSTLRQRIEELGITEAIVQRQGEFGIRIELPGVQDPSEAKRIIGATASLSFHGLSDIGGKRVVSEDGGAINIDIKVIFTGNDITGAQAGRDEMGQPMVQLQLSSFGGEKINRFSRTHIGEPMATLYSEYVTDARGDVQMQERVISVATINEALGTRFSITGLGSWQRAQDLALILRAGSLEAPIKIIKEQTITPTLGAQNITNGFQALLLGLSITLGFMLLWYRRLGVVANLALAINLVCLLGLMSLLPGVVLTLPGIAGLVLTIGMAVDTNVIIFERVKDEIRLGRTRLQALQRGYKQAMSSIIDANLTTFICALVLIGIGYGPVKGFAITLALGIMTSVFSGVIVSSYLSSWLFKATKEVGHA
ncbi:protein translocase subunit SecD [Pseudoalteromonas sp. YIC-656]|uniref:protein translocase subunit SecD n=1 Tax=Pseudoalteromonas pernae TaxID=3118054 RepID=UPI0032423BB8